jgi:hypothetical protein
MLYISRGSSKYWGKSSLREVLQACSALKKDTSVAFHFEVEKNRKVDLIESLRHYTGLEGVFVLMKERRLGSKNAGRQGGFILNELA